MFDLKFGTALVIPGKFAYVSMNIDKTQDCVGMKWVVLGSKKRISEAQKFLDDYIVLHTATPELEKVSKFVEEQIEAAE